MKDLQAMSLAELWELFPIVLKEHNPEYMAWYEEERAKLHALLKEYDIYRISHIGSTAVKGLLAKPIVDILLEADAGQNADGMIVQLQENGWILMGRDDAAGTFDLNKGYTPQGFARKVFHLHIKRPGAWGELYFRDYLRKYPQVAKQYETLKLSLKEQYEHNRDAYTDAKSNFVREHTQKALKEFGKLYSPSHTQN